MDSESFEYESLAWPDIEIRLLELLPGEESTQLHCKLIVRSLARVPRYAAISYHWGDVLLSGHRTVWIDDKALVVRENCYHALHQVRLNLQYLPILRLKYIWIDSICIDQKNLQEKAAQVQIMASHIYPKASCVFISLSSESKKIQNFMQELVRLDLEGLLAPGTSNEKLGIKEALDPCLAIGHLPYWKRLWILPEILTASDLRILCGSLIVHWAALRTFLGLPQIATTNGKGDISFDNVLSSPLGSVYRTKDTIGSRIELSQLENLLEAHSEWRCADPRDHFYAFWSMLNWPVGTRKLKVDYETPTIQLVTEILQLINRQGRARSLDRICASVSNLLAVFDVNAGDLVSYAATPTDSSGRITSSAAGNPGHPTYVYLSNNKVATIEADSDGYMSIRAFRSDETSRFSYLNRKPLSMAECRPLFSRSSIIGWLCPDAEVGDLLLEFAVKIRRLHLVLRRRIGANNRNADSDEIFKIIGQATIDPNFALFPDPARRTLGNFTYSYIATPDLVSLVAPVFLSRTDNSEHETHHLRPATPWPTRGDLSLIYKFAVVLNGAGKEIDGCISCGASGASISTAPTLPCGHKMCATCLKQHFEASIQDCTVMPPMCCTERPIPLACTANFFDNEFHRRWKKAYQKFKTHGADFQPEPTRYQIDETMLRPPLEDLS